MAGTVAVLGGGIGGLSAAHELAERRFKVRVYERKPIFGGKARSIPVPGSGVDGRKPLPGEHGFRFFPHFYRHIPDTMGRIPYPGNPRGVLDNLVPTSRTILARAGHPDLHVLSRYPRTLREWSMAGQGLFRFLQLVPPGEMLYYTRRLLVMLTSCDERRLAEYERIGWWDFTKAATRSPGYQQFLGQGFTRMMVAVKAEEGSARTVGSIGLQLGLGLLTRGIDVDSVLKGPTNEMWIDPWVAHLKSLGVEFESDTLVKEIRVAGGEVLDVAIEAAGKPRTIIADSYVAALPVEVMTMLLTPELKAAAPSIANIGRLRTAWMNGIQFYFEKPVPLTHGHVLYADSPWALTSVSQEQFWDGLDLTEYGDGTVRGVLSVDISDWEAPGLLYGRPANECSAEEIKNEVWVQILAHLDAEHQRALVSAKMVRWFLDPSIEFPNPSAVTNLEPLLINTIDSYRDRPEAHTEIPNLFLAADYVRTNTDLACMEAANEAGRRATNALLDRTGSGAPRAQLWSLVEPPVFERFRRWDSERFAAGQAHSSTAALVSAARRRLARR